MIQIRWIMLVLGLFVLLIAIAKRELKPASTSFLIGVITGFVVDSALMNWHLREYPGPMIIWWTITLPCWGVLSLAVNIIWNRLRQWNPWIVLLMMVAGLAILIELPNMATGSWVYHSPIWLIVAGWLMGIFYLRVAYMVVAEDSCFSDAIYLRSLFWR